MAVQIIGYELWIKPWNISGAHEMKINRQFWRIRQHSSWQQFLMSFFKFFCQFKYARNAIQRDSSKKNVTQGELQYQNNSTIQIAVRKIKNKQKYYNLQSTKQKSIFKRSYNTKHGLVHNGFAASYGFNIFFLITISIVELFQYCLSP